MTDMATPTRPLSFWKLLQKYKVQIPVIQRDYAQGRASKEKVLNNFLQALHEAVTTTPSELDFIYGDVTHGVFCPLDGQQRLTTLFLLHWYAARSAGLSLDSYAGQLGRFSYKTRVSSRNFCEKLLLEPVDVRNGNESQVLSQRIKDCAWFVGTWEFDPTVAGMLTALDKISSLKWPDGLWGCLTNDEATAPIRFRLVELAKFGLSDDLYIKMNARGKPLTPFETFKALLGKRIGDEGWEQGVEEVERFAIRIDTCWTHLFWSICPDTKSGLKAIDEVFLSFIRHSLACSIAHHAESAEQVANTLQLLLKVQEPIDPKTYTKTFYEELRDRLDLLSQKTEAIRQEARNKWQFGYPYSDAQVSILEEVIRNSEPQYKQRLIVYAQFLLHACNENVAAENADNWRRVVRNIITHSTVDSPETFVAGVRLVDELAKGINSIYEFLVKEVVKSGFAGKQVEEERRKARLIVRHPDQAALIHHLENTDFLQGRIAFALDCVGQDPASFDCDFEKLHGVAAVIENEFGNGINNIIRRAFLTIGNQDEVFFKYWSGRLGLLNLPKYCLIADNNEFRNFAYPGHKSQLALKAFVLDLLGKTCAQLIEDYVPAEGTPNWRTRLIKEAGVIDLATAHYIALDEDNHVVYPIPGVRPHDNAATRAYLENNKIQ
jgi:hypothetical protein